MNVPEPWAFVLLALGALRLTRLVGWDTITDPVRSWLTGHHSDGRRRDRSKRDRPKWMLFLTCPWCLGAHISGIVWGAWQIWPHWTLILLTPFAINEIVGLVVKNLDE